MGTSPWAPGLGDEVRSLEFLAMASHLTLTTDTHLYGCRLQSVPLVCKAWAELARAASPLWEHCNVIASRYDPDLDLHKVSLAPPPPKINTRFDPS